MKLKTVEEKFQEIVIANLLNKESKSKEEIEELRETFFAGFSACLELAKEASDLSLEEGEKLFKPLLEEVDAYWGIDTNKNISPSMG